MRTFLQAEKAVANHLPSFFSLDSGEQICTIVALLDILIFKPIHLKVQITFFVMVGIDLNCRATYNLS